MVPLDSCMHSKGCKLASFPGSPLRAQGEPGNEVRVQVL